VSSGSACTSASLEPSYVLRALGVEEDMAHTSLRSDGQDETPLVLLLAALCICSIFACQLHVAAEHCLSCITSQTNPKHYSANGLLFTAQQVYIHLQLYWHTSSFAICSIDESVPPFVSIVLTLCAMQIWPRQIHNGCRS